MSDIEICTLCEEVIDELGAVYTDSEDNPVCEDCYFELFDASCERCGERLESDLAESVGRFISVSPFRSALEEGIAPGVYKIVAHPLFDRRTGRFIKNSLQFVSDVPAGNDHIYICLNCSVYYQ